MNDVIELLKSKRDRLEREHYDLIIEYARKDRERTNVDQIWYNFIPFERFQEYLHNVHFNCKIDDIPHESWIRARKLHSQIVALENGTKTVTDLLIEKLSND